MNAVALAISKWPWRLLAVAACVALPLSAQAQAQIQITPLPEQKAASVIPLGAHELTASDAQPWIDEQMAKAMAPGAVVAVVKDGNMLVSKGYGYADVAAKKPIDPATTLFHVGQVSTLLTWTAVMQLVEQHKLDLDADVNRYLDFTIPPRDGKPITLRDLMTHTAGFENALKDLSITDPKRLETSEAWLKRWVPARIHPAGEVPAYSNYGGALAGYIVQRVSGQPFNEYMAKRVFQPMGMQHASFDQPPGLHADEALGYSMPAAPLPRPLFLPVPALALSISGEDMARFMIAHLQFGRAGEAQLLEQPTVKLMHDYQRATIPGLPGMALGFAHLDRNGETILGQEGGIPGFHSLVALFPERHAGIFIATNGSPDDRSLQQLVDGFSERYFPPLPQLKLPTLATAKQHAAQLAGRYMSSITSQGNVLALRDLFHPVWVSAAADGTLRVPLLGPAQWREVKPYVWLDDASGRHLAAVVRDGKVRMWSIDTMSPAQAFLPATGWSPARVCSTLLVLLAAFALIALSWPVVAVLRRRGTVSALTEQDERWYRLSRLTAILYLLFAAGWRLMLPRLGAPHLELHTLLLMLIGLLAVLGTIPVVIETWRAWRTPGAWWRRVSGVVLLLACIAAMAFIANFHLLSPSLNY